jgi:PAS domain S-box-containing protein
MRSCQLARYTASSDRPHVPESDAKIIPLATLVPATSRWIGDAGRRHAITLGTYLIVLTVVNLAGAKVDPRTYIIFLVWIGTNFVMAPWAARVHDYDQRLNRYALTLAADVVFLGGIYVMLDAAQWMGAVFFVHSALVASATLPRRHSMAIAALIVVVFSIDVLLAVSGMIVVPSPFGLSPVRGNWAFAFASIGTSVGLIGVLMLLQQRLVSTIRDAEQRYQLLVQAAPDMVMTFDNSGRFVDVNPATLQQSGYTWAELKQMPNTAFFPPEDWPKIMQARQRNIAGETVVLEIRYVRKNGEVRWIQTTSSPFRRDGEGAVLVLARDVTDARRQTDALRANDERFRLIIASLDLGFYTIDTTQRVTGIFGVFNDLELGDRPELIGRGSHELLPELAALQHDEANARVLAGEDVTFQWSTPETEYMRERYYRSHLAPLRDGDGAIVGVAGLWTDETISVQAERERDMLRDRVADAERIESLGKLVSGVAHELNNPLAAILNFTEDLLADARPDEERMALEVIQSQALRSRTIVRDLLTFVRKGDRRPRKVEAPAPILETLIRALKPGLATQGVSFASSISDGDTPILIDRAGFEQVVTNLITNAAHASGAGGAVRLTSKREDDCFTVIVEDNGPGIKQENFSRIFEPFFTTKPTGQGVGLGLSVSLGIVQAHGGELTAENRPAEVGGGAQFVIRVPMSAAAPGTIIEPSSGPTKPRPLLPPRVSASAAAAAAEDIVPLPPRRPSLLVVDDEESIRRAMRRYFERRGWAVDEAGDGTDALVKLLKSDAGLLYDVILCDLKMPGVSGPELYARLQAEAPILVPRLILSTGDVSAPDVEAFLAGVNVPVLEKPFELLTLEKLAEQVRAKIG